LTDDRNIELDLGSANLNSIRNIDRAKWRHSNLRSLCCMASCRVALC